MLLGWWEQRPGEDHRFPLVDGASLNLMMVDARPLFFQRAIRRRWSLAEAAGFGKYRKS
jgi:hypothetical protein